MVNVSSSTNYPPFGVMKKQLFTLQRYKKLVQVECKSKINEERDLFFCQDAT